MNCGNFELGFNNIGLMHDDDSSILGSCSGDSIVDFSSDDNSFSDVAGSSCNVDDIILRGVAGGISASDCDSDGGEGGRRRR